MCIQYVCHICDRDLEDENSLVPCFESQETLPLTFGNQQHCPNYLRTKASTSSWCNSCSEVNPSALEDFQAPTVYMCVHNE